MSKRRTLIQVLPLCMHILLLSAYHTVYKLRKCLDLHWATATLEVHWAHYSVCTVYTASVRPVYTLTTLEFGLGMHEMICCTH